MYDKYHKSKVLTRDFFNDEDLKTCTHLQFVQQF